MCMERGGRLAARSSTFTQSDSHMTPEQIKLANELLALLEQDEVAQSDCATYGDWLEHMSDHLTDIHMDICRQLTGINA